MLTEKFWNRFKFYDILLIPLAGLVLAFGLFLVIFPHISSHSLVHFQLSSNLLVIWLSFVILAVILTLGAWRVVRSVIGLILICGLGLILLRNTSGPLALLRLSLTAVITALVGGGLVIGWKIKPPARLLPIISSPWLIVAIFTFLYSFLTIARHMHLESHAFDLGIFTQVVYKYAHFEGTYNTIRGMNILGDHFHPILLALVPLWWVWPSAKMLLIVQAFIVSLAAVPIYLLAFRQFNNRWLAWGLAVTFLLAPGIQAGIGFDFHEIMFFPTGLLFLAYFGITNQKIGYWLVLVLTLMVKENVPLYILAFAIPFGILTKQWKQALITMLVAGLYMAVVLKIAMPHFVGGSVTSYQYFNFGDLGQTPGQLLKNLIFHPAHVLQVFFNPSLKRETMAALLVSSGFLILFSPIWLIATVPMLFEQFLFDVPSHWTFQFHYAAAIAAPLILGAIFALEPLASQLARVSRGSVKTSVSTIRNILVGFAVLSALFLTINQRHLLVNLANRNFIQSDSAISQAIALSQTIPQNASVAASHALVPHLAGRDTIIAWPATLPIPALNNLDQEYIILNLAGSLWPNDLNQQIDLINSLVINPPHSYGLIAITKNQSAVLFKRNVPSDPTALASWASYYQSHKNQL